MRKNQGGPSRGAPGGIVLNPYLIGYPAYEHWSGYIPYVYWQGNPPADIAARALDIAQKSLDRYFPGVDAKDLEIWMNSTRNFGGHFAPAIREALRRNGVGAFRENDYFVDEAWDLSDGQYSQSERVAMELSLASDGFHQWRDTLEPLSVLELMDVAAGVTGIEVRHPLSAGTN